MPLTDAAKEIALNALAGVNPPAQLAYVSLHSAQPNPSGSDEISGGSPAYARAAVTWNPAAGDQINASNNPVMNVPAGTTITHVGLWSQQVGGTFLGYGAISSGPESYGAQGTFTLTSIVLVMQDA